MTIDKNIIRYTPSQLFVVCVSVVFTSVDDTFRWFRQSNLSSFIRQLNLYGFKRITQGKERQELNKT
jgi:HSF-type DNA-binding